MRYVALNEIREWERERGMMVSANWVELNEN